MEEHIDKYNIELHVHHKTKLKSFLSDEPTVEEFEKANSYDNLVTFCIQCHKSEETL